MNRVTDHAAVGCRIQDATGIRIQPVSLMGLHIMFVHPGIPALVMAKRQGRASRKPLELVRFDMQAGYVCTAGNGLASFAVTVQHDPGRRVVKRQLYKKNYRIQALKYFTKCSACRTPKETQKGEHY